VPSICMCRSKECNSTCSMGLGFFSSFLIAIEWGWIGLLSLGGLIVGENEQSLSKIGFKSSPFDAMYLCLVSWKTIMVFCIILCTTGLISLYTIISSFLQSHKVELISLVQNLNASDLKYQLPIYTAPIKDHQGWEIWEFTKVEQKLKQ